MSDGPFYRLPTKCEGDLHLLVSGNQCQCERDKFRDCLRNAGIFFALQFISYFNVTLDMRAVQHGQYAVAAITNVIAPLIAWLMVERIGKAKDRWGMVGSVLGGVTSTWAGMWLTRFW